MRLQNVTIFSREGQISYQWIMRFLSIHQVVREVQGFYISNSNQAKFKQAVSWSTFAILYHSKTRGRVNVTDVTDSLYDDELDYLSKQLGKENVFVVIDHLSDGSDQKKIEILHGQPSIQRLAKELFIFSVEEHNLLSHDGVVLHHVILDEKMKQMTGLVQAAASRGGEEQVEVPEDQWDVPARPEDHPWYSKCFKCLKIYKKVIFGISLVIFVMGIYKWRGPKELNL